LARKLRRELTPAEASLWAHLRNRRFEGFKFRRQHPFGPYILDFYCHERALAIEVDGGGHFTVDQESRDEARTAFLEDAGLAVLRVTNADVLTNVFGVGDYILEELKRRPPHPNPLPPGRGNTLSDARPSISGNGAEK
jgi:very-short-patch-repair endonuclease